MDAMIFDFDGVVVDSEPIHFRSFAKVLVERGVDLTARDYYAKYLGYDDHDCFGAIFRDVGREISPQEIQDLIAKKTALVQQAFSLAIEPLPGAVALIRQAEMAAIPLAVCSGALRGEIELAARAAGVLEYFMAIVSADDVDRGKPDPQGYRKALTELARFSGRALNAAKTVVIEDSPAGIEAAKAAGMKVLAVANSYEPSALAQADRIVSSLSDVTPASLDEML